MFAGNIRNFLAGSPRARELRDMREGWERTQALWHGSVLGTNGSSDLTLALGKKIIGGLGRVPVAPVLLAMFEAIDTLYRAEEIGRIEAEWDVLEHSPETAIAFRDMMARRTRWACDFGSMNGAFERIVTNTISAFMEALPECCMARWHTEGAFDVPLLDVVDDPAGLVDGLFMLPYTDDTFRFDLFKHLLSVCRRNVLVASGFLPDADPLAAKDRLIRPKDQKKQYSSRELADLYLGGSPLRALLDVPIPFSIPDEARFEHCHVIGGTGHGKTQLLQKMIHADLLASRDDGRSVVVIDSQGDLINKLVRLELFSPSTEGTLADRLVLIDPADIEYPAALNLFDAHLDRLREYSAADRERVLNGVIELYELFFGAFLGAELTQKQGVIFKYLARLMLAIPGATIHTLMKVMENGREYQQYIDTLDGSARYFFETEFFAPSFAATKKQVLRRLWGVLSTPAFERMFTQPENKLDLFEAMNEGKIILVSTAKDLLKQEGSQLLGRFFIAMIAQAALERSTLPEHERAPVFVYVDEAQEYFDDSIETILNQARKYRVGLTLAHQTLDQLSPRLRSAMFANTSVKCVGGVSAKDARVLADELRTTPDFVESMKRRGQRTEFAVWVKHLTGQAIRLNCPLGFLERQPTLEDQELERLIGTNRSLYGGTPQKLLWLSPPAPTPRPPVRQDPPPASDAERDSPRTSPSSPLAPPPTSTRPPAPPPIPVRVERQPPPLEGEPRETGKGGQNHRYLQSLVQELANQQGIRATLEAPLPRGGQVDVLLERNGVLAAIEISVSTPASYEAQNVRKCLDAGYPRVGVVLAKSKKAQANFIAAITGSLSAEDREKVSFLVPEDLPDFIAALVPASQPPERVVRGYKVKGAVRESSPEEARARRDIVAKLISSALTRREQ